MDSFNHSNSDFILAIQYYQKNWNTTPSKQTAIEPLSSRYFRMSVRVRSISKTQANTRHDSWLQKLSNRDFMFSLRKKKEPKRNEKQNENEVQKESPRTARNDILTPAAKLNDEK